MKICSDIQNTYNSIDIITSFMRRKYAEYFILIHWNNSFTKKMFEIKVAVVWKAINNKFSKKLIFYIRIIAIFFMELIFA